MSEHPLTSAAPFAGEGRKLVLPPMLRTGVETLAMAAGTWTPA